MDPVKVAGVTEWPIPSNRKEVQSFLGFTNFYHKFIQGFSHLAHPLFNLTWKDTEWRWGAEEQSAFDALKEQITKAVILTLPDNSQPFRSKRTAQISQPAPYCLNNHQKTINGTP